MAALSGVSNGGNVPLLLAGGVEETTPAHQPGHVGSMPTPRSYHFHLNDKRSLSQLVHDHHYSARLPGSIQLIATWHDDGGLFGDSGEAVAGLSFSSPPTRWSEPVLELTRLVRSDDCCRPLTGFIAEAVSWVRHKRMADLLVSFADPTFGHHGGIYQAASWHYHGRRDAAVDGIVLNGKFIPGRTCNATWGTRSPEKLRGMGIPAEAHWDAGKHLYWRPVTRRGIVKAKRLGLLALPYPKPALVEAVA